MGDCGKRSFAAAIRWAGLDEKILDGFDLSKSEGCIAASVAIGVEWKESRELLPGNYPGIVVYRDGREFTDSEYHAVFVSDLAPFGLLADRIYAVITGWERIRKSP